MERQEVDRTDAGNLVISPRHLSSLLIQDMKIVWSCYLNTARFHTWKETPSLLCTVQCESLPVPQPLLRVCDLCLAQAVHCACPSC